MQVAAELVTLFRQRAAGNCFRASRSTRVDERARAVLCSPQGSRVRKPQLFASCCRSCLLHAAQEKVTRSRTRWRRCLDTDRVNFGRPRSRANSHLTSLYSSSAVTVVRPPARPCESMRL